MVLAVPEYWATKVESINMLIRPGLAYSGSHRTIGAVAAATQPAHGAEVDGRPLEGEFLRNAKIVNKMITVGRVHVGSHSRGP
jgi:hypothetical protein